MALGPNGLANRTKAPCEVAAAPWITRWGLGRRSGGRAHHVPAAARQRPSQEHFMALDLAFARPGSTRASRRFTASARTAAILLLFVWLGPVSFAQTELWQLLKWAGAPTLASAEQQVIPAGQALVLTPGTLLKLWLRDASVVEGRFLGRALLDSSLYASRFAAYARTSDFVPFALGETLRVSL